MPTVIEQEASIVLKIEKDSKSGNTQIIVSKNMYGDTGTINATFDSGKLLFYEV